VPPLSSFVTLLEYYGLQLQHLSPNSIALVAIFVHLCEMYVGVRPSVRLFRCFFVLKAASPCPLLIGGYYFQCRTQGHATTSCPFPLAGGNDGEKTGRWCRRMPMIGSCFPSPAQPSTAPSGRKTPVWSQYLAENGLTSLMVLHDFLSKCLMPLQDRSHRPAWMYTRVNDIKQLDRGPGSSLDVALLVASLKALMTD
jgi:hypothetical protein